MSTWVTITDHWSGRKLDINLDHIGYVARMDPCGCGSCVAPVPLTLWRSLAPFSFPVVDPGEAAYVELVLQRIRFVP